MSFEKTAGYIAWMRCVTLEVDEIARMHLLVAYILRVCL